MSDSICAAVTPPTTLANEDSEYTTKMSIYDAAGGAASGAVTKNSVQDSGTRSRCLNKWWVFAEHSKFFSGRSSESLQRKDECFRTLRKERCGRVDTGSDIPTLGRGVHLDGGLQSSVRHGDSTALFVELEALVHGKRKKTITRSGREGASTTRRAWHGAVSPTRASLMRPCCSRAGLLSRGSDVLTQRGMAIEPWSRLCSWSQRILTKPNLKHRGDGLSDVGLTHR